MAARSHDAKTFFIHLLNIGDLGFGKEIVEVKTMDLSMLIYLIEVLTTTVRLCLPVYGMR